MRKNSIFMTGMLALLLTFGLALAGCPNGNDDDDDGGGGGTTVTVKITNNSGKEVKFFVEVLSVMMKINTESKSIAAGATETITISYTDTTGKDMSPTGLLLTVDEDDVSGNYSGSAPIEVTFDGEKFTPNKR
jgi:hypothetical protein